MQQDQPAILCSDERSVLPVKAGAAGRVARHRQRRREGLRYVGVNLRENEIQMLVQKELLAVGAGDDANAIATALRAFLDMALVAEPDSQSRPAEKALRVTEKRTGSNPLTGFGPGRSLNTCRSPFR